MKPLLKIIDTRQNSAFRINKVQESCFFPSWHFHPECEIMLVLEGTGIRFVGDSMERFQPGDLIFYGPHIPHLYRSDSEYYDKESGLCSKAIVVYFKEDFLGKGFLDLPEIIPIKKLFANSVRGVKFKGKAKEVLSKQIQDLYCQKNGIESIIQLLAILKTMSDTHEFHLLSSIGFTKNIEKADCKRINEVYQFVMDKYSESPSLEKVSEIANMSASAFCRYFKLHTNKTYTQFLNEVKIGNACKLLLNNNQSISQVCYEIGFNNFTHFNSQFKRIIGLTPREYKSRHI